MDEWVRAILSGVIGGVLVAGVQWYRLRDELLTRRRSLFLDVYTAADAFYNTRTLDPNGLQGWDLFAAFGRARAALMLVETDPEILAKLKQLEDPTLQLFRIWGPIKNSQEFGEKSFTPKKELRRCMREFLEAARNAFRIVAG